MGELLTGTRVKMNANEGLRWKAGDIALVMETRPNDVLLKFRSGDQAHCLRSEFDILRTRRMVDANKGESRLTPKTVWIDWSILKDGEVEFEDLIEDRNVYSKMKRKPIKYVRVDE